METLLNPHLKLISLFFLDAQSTAPRSGSLLPSSTFSLSAGKPNGELLERKDCAFSLRTTTVLCPECIILHVDACVPGFSLEPLDGKFSGHTDFVLFMFLSPVLNRLSHGRCASVYCKIGVAQGIDREAQCPRGCLNTPGYTWPPTSEGSTCDFLSLRWCGNDTYSVENVLGICIFSWPSSTVISPELGGGSTLR